jgi:hypothetical protein
VATPQAFLYPALAIGAPAGFILAVQNGGVRMPAPQVIEAPPPAVVVPAPEVIQAPPPPPPYVPPVRPRKQDRY